MNISASTNSNQVQPTPSTSSTQPDAATILATLITMIQNGQIQIPTSNTTEQDSEEKKLAELQSVPHATLYDSMFSRPRKTERLPEFQSMEE